MNALDTRINALSNNIAGTSEKKKGYTEDETEKDFLDSKLTKDKTIANDDAIVMNYDERNEAVASLPPLPPTENIMKHETLNNDKEPEENNVVLTTNKDVDEREVVIRDMEAFETDAEGNDLLEFEPEENNEVVLTTNEGMEVSETREAERNAFKDLKDLLKRESNVSEQEDKPITDDMEIRDQGGVGGGGGPHVTYCSK